MNFLLSSASELAGAFGTIILYILLGLVGIAVIIASIWVSISKIRVWWIYRKYNKIANSENLSAREATEKFKNFCELKNVKVEKVGFFKSFLGLGSVLGFGNEYNAKKKTIYLRKNIIEKNSITAVGVATQKVGAAYLDEHGDEDYKLVSKFKPWTILAPILFIPLVVIGVILDFILTEMLGFFGLFSIIFSAVSVGFLILSLKFMKKAIKCEIKANDYALQMMNQADFLTAEERGYIKKIYDAYIISYKAEYVQLIIEIIYELLKLALQILKTFSKNKAN